MPETPASSNLSGYTPHLARSLEIIERASPSHSASIIDVGGGESTLVDDLLTRGYQNVTVLDVSQIAMDVTKKRLGTASESVRWIVADVTKAEFAPRAYDVWRDRQPRGYVLLSTFGTEGPTKCSGLDVVRYDAHSLHLEFGVRFRLLESFEELHRTPFGTDQQFLYCLCRIE